MLRWHKYRRHNHKQYRRNYRYDLYHLPHLKKCNRMRLCVDILADLSASKANADASVCKADASKAYPSACKADADHNINCIKLKTHPLQI